MTLLNCGDKIRTFLQHFKAETINQMDFEDICPQKFNTDLQEDRKCLYCLEGNPKATVKAFRSALLLSLPHSPKHAQLLTVPSHTTEISPGSTSKALTCHFTVTYTLDAFESPLQQLSQNEEGARTLTQQGSTLISALVRPNLRYLVWRKECSGRTLLL